MAYQVVDFQDIQDAIREELKVQSSDLVTMNRVKRVINQVYLQEVVPFARWKWLEGSYRVIHKARINTDTCQVTPNSDAVIFNTAPSASLGSFAGKKFAADGYNEIYIIATHTAGSVNFTLSGDYTGNLSLTAGYKIWTDVVNLPTDCRETVSVWHNFHSKPMEGVGQQKFRSLSLLNPRAESYPSLYYTADFYAPTSPETEDDRYRQMYLHPAVNKTDVTLQIDYIKELSALNLAGDEPAMPVEDRVVLVYGALARLWKSVNSDIDMAQLAQVDFKAKLARMSGKVEDSQDSPKLKPDSSYVRTRRASRFSPTGHSLAGVGGGSGYEQVTFLEDVTIKGATITANVTVSDGVTIDGVDISSISTGLSDHLADTVDAHDASAISFAAVGNIVATDVQAALLELDGDKVNGPGAVTDNAVVRFDSTSGTSVQNSVVIVSDTGVISQATGLVMDILTSATLTDNTGSPTAIFAEAFASYASFVIDYTLSRGTGNREVGTLYMLTDGTTSDVSGGGASIGTLGVAFTAAVNGSNVELKYTTTSTGTNVTMKYRITKWAD